MHHPVMGGVVAGPAVTAVVPRSGSQGPGSAATSKESWLNTQQRASGGCLRLLVARKDVASDVTLWGPAGRG